MPDAIELKTGRYRMRNGAIAIITDVDTSDQLLPFEGYFEGAGPEARGQCWYYNGNFSAVHMDGDNDLVEYLEPVESFEKKIRHLHETLPDLGTTRDKEILEIHEQMKRDTVVFLQETRLRDEFAMAAMQGVIANSHYSQVVNIEVAAAAYAIANAMLKEREKWTHKK